MPNYSSPIPPDKMAAFLIQNSPSAKLHEVSHFSTETVIVYSLVVDGFNLPVSMKPIGGGIGCGIASCEVDLNVCCPSALEVKRNGKMKDLFCLLNAVADGNVKDEIIVFSRQGDGGSRQNCRAESQSNGTGQSDALVESTREINKSNGPTENHTNPSGAINDTEYHDTGTGSPIQRGNLNKNDNISKTSRVENLSSLNWFFIFAFKVLTDFLMVGTGYNRAVSLIYYTMSEGCHVTADHLIVYCLLATEFWMYSCLGFLLLSSPCHHWGRFPCTAPKDLSYEGDQVMQDDPSIDVTLQQISVPFYSQQRVFAVQVFELHRLIKVQQLIAGSPDLLFEDAAFLGKSLPDGSTPKKLPIEYVVKARLQNLKRKVDSEKIDQNMQCSAENAVGKTSISSVKNGSHLSSSMPFAGNPHQGNMAAENGVGPWCFNQSTGHQWLIPVMSPSEGLVYKPYPGPGFTGTNFGGCGPFGAAPSGGAFMNPSYGIPPPPETPPGSHPYFPPYGGMPFMKAAASESVVEQVNQLSARGQDRHLSEVEADCSKHNQSSGNLPVQRNGATSPHVMYRQRSKEFDLQMSTASSPSEMAQEMSTGQVAEGRDALPLFPMVPAEPEGVSQSLETGQQTRVIKVVPHNRRSATESAARIFQSIQEERKQYDIL
ncbi:protein EARLY FLOWERING [Trifolium repens]|nr:protein EARLY FLOWERING [Trifolium repens]